MGFIRFFGFSVGFGKFVGWFKIDLKKIHIFLVQFDKQQHGGALFPNACTKGASICSPRIRNILSYIFMNIYGCVYLLADDGSYSFHIHHHFIIDSCSVCVCVYFFYQIVYLFVVHIIHDPHTIRFLLLSIHHVRIDIAI